MLNSEECHFYIKDIEGPFHLKSTPPLLLITFCEFHCLRRTRSECWHIHLFRKSWQLISTLRRNRVPTRWNPSKCSSDPPPQISSTRGVDFKWNGLVWFTYLRFLKLIIFRELLSEKLLIKEMHFKIIFSLKNRKAKAFFFLGIPENNLK